MVRFALTGAGGYVAPRHMNAIKETNNDLICMLDPNDSIGIVDRYFPEARYFSEFEKFDRYVDKLYRMDKKIDYLSICSPNDFHDSHIRYGLKNNMDVICEKPLVINPWNLNTLIEMEKESGNRVNCILQLRLHPKIVELKKIVQKSKERYKINLDYITPRGNWYFYSWKGDRDKSGGLATNIGIHFFDMLMWIFGDSKLSLVNTNTKKQCSGYLELEKADVNWSLSIDKKDLPHDEWKAYRSLKINGEEFDFSSGFEDLHTLSYKEILKGNGYSISDAKNAVQLVYDIRNARWKKKFI